MGEFARRTREMGLDALKGLMGGVKTFWLIFSQLFCDFGENFEVLDPNEEAPASAIIESISQVSPHILKPAHPAESFAG